MNEHLYELLWQVETDTHNFLYREFKVFCTYVEAKKHGKIREKELNEEASIEERAQDGYYFKYLGVNKVTKIDGFIVKLAR